MFAATVAVARLAVLSAIRSRLFITLIVVLLVTVAGLPLTVRGDGTIEGQIRVALVYTLGLASFILTLATLWASCGAVSQEIQERQIQLIVTKPVHRVAVWLGKWLGLLFMNAVLLVFSGAVVYGLVRWQTRPSAVSAEDARKLREEILIGRLPLEPHARSLDDEAHRRLQQMIAEGVVAREAPHGEAIAEVRRRIQAEDSTVGPGRTRQWVFDPPPRIAPGTAVALRYRLSSPTRYRTPVSGTWIVGPPGAAERFSAAVTHEVGGVHRLVIPSRFIRGGAPLTVEFANGPQAQSSTAVFDMDRGVELLIDESGFEANLARGLLVVFCRLALVAAIGMTAGSIFSFPVATFIALSLLVSAGLVHVFTVTSFEGCGCGMDEVAGQTTLMQAVGERLIERLSGVVEPVMRMNPLSTLGEGLLVSWGMTVRAVGLMLVLYPALLGGFSGWALRRRELALPGAGGG